MEALRSKMLAAIQKLRYIDDIFFSVSLDGYKPGVELILRTVMGDDRITVDEVLTQETVTNLYGKSVRFDVFATAGEKKYNCEIQRADGGALPRRARYNSAMLDARSLRKGAGHEALPETAVIFICAHDVLGRGLPLYHIGRTVAETGEAFDDGAAILYVNGECRDETPLGRLMHDFFCRDAKDMHYGVLAERMKYFKENEGGESVMCEVMENLVSEVMEDMVKDREAQAEARGKAQGKAQGVIEGKAQGIIEGKAQGMIEGKAQGVIEGKAQGMIEGKAQGIIEGKAQEREELAVRALSMKKLSLEEIAEMFRLSIGRVTELGRLHSLL